MSVYAPSLPHNQAQINSDKWPDEMLVCIFTWVGYGASDGEMTCPVARIACVCRRWYHIFHQMNENKMFVTAPLKRIMDWTVRMDERTASTWNGQGDVESIVDPASRRILPRWQDSPDHRFLPLWWTSNDRSFAGDHWVDRGIELRPAFDCINPDSPPTLEVYFSSPIIVRAIAIECRNIPRLVRVGADTKDDETKDFHIQFRPSKQPVAYKIQTKEYMAFVAAYLPQGQPASEKAISKMAHLPVVLPRPILCKQKMRLHLMQSHEARWVGLNVLGMFGDIAHHK